VWISVFVVALTRRTATQGMLPVSPTAIGVAEVLASPCSAARAWALIVGVKPSSGKNNPRCAWVRRTSTIGPDLPSSSNELQSAVLFVVCPTVPMLQFVPLGQFCVEFSRMWKFGAVPLVRFGMFWYWAGVNVEYEYGRLFGTVYGLPGSCFGGP